MTRRFLPLLMLLATCAPCVACIHTIASYHDVVMETTKQALLFDDGRQAHLVIQTGLQARRALPSTVAWVIPLPALPTSYSVADPGLFPELFRTVETAQANMFGGVRSHSIPKTAAAAPPAIQVYAAQQVGDYQIQPVKILSARTASSALNDWLTRHGFGAFPMADQRPYLHKGYVFLAVRMTHLSGVAAQLKPLHIVYPWQTLTLPLKLSTNSGVFNVMLYTYTPRPLRGNVFGPERIFPDGPDLPITDFSTVPLLARLVGNRHGYLMRWQGQSFNRPEWPVHALPADPTLDARLPGVSDWSQPITARPRVGFLGSMPLLLALGVLAVGLGLGDHLRGRVRSAVTRATSAR